MGRKSRQNDYNILAERAAEDPRARAELERFHGIEKAGGDPEIEFGRHGRINVRDKYPLPRNIR